MTSKYLESFVFIQAHGCTEAYLDLKLKICLFLTIIIEILNISGNNPSSKDLLIRFDL